MPNCRIQSALTAETCLDKLSYNLTTTLNQHDHFNPLNELKSTIDQLTPHKTPYAFYNLGLSAEEINLISQINVKSHQTQSFKFNNSSLTNDIENLCRANLSPQKLCQDFSRTTNKLISNILDATNSTAAELKFIAHANFAHPFPDWHLDKRHDESPYSQKEDPTKAYQYVFIFSLVGSKTIFSKPDVCINKDFLIEYDAAYAISSDVHSYLDLATADSAGTWQGSVHFAGQEDGTIHSGTTSPERLLFVVIPGNEEEVNALYNIEHSITIFI